MPTASRPNASTGSRAIAPIYRDDRNYMKFLIPKGVRVLDLGCGNGDLLAELEPSYGLGIDISPAMIDRAKRLYPNLSFVVGDIEDETVIDAIDGPFDYIVLSDTVGMLDDIETALRRLQPLCGPDTRVIIAYYSQLWEPLLKVAEWVGLKMPQPPTNYLNTTDFLNILDLADFEPIKMDYRQLVPRRLLGLGTLINRFIAPMPGIRRLCLRTYVVARSLTAKRPAQLSASIVIPCRNERGNIETAIKRLPAFGKAQEIIYVEGNSSDGTYEECLRVKEAYAATHDIKVLKQDGRGKGDAVRKAFANASGDVLMILDADLTMPPEALPKFHAAIESGKADFVNGTRLVYPMDDEAMRPLNFVANRFFAGVFSYLVNQRFSDTLCGTKVAQPHALRGDRPRTRLFRRFRSVRRFRSDLRRSQAEPENRRGPGPLRRTGLWRDPDFALPRRLAAASHGRLCIHEAESVLSRDVRECNIRWPRLAARGSGV